MKIFVILGALFLAACSTGRAITVSDNGQGFNSAMNAAPLVQRSKAERPRTKVYPQPPVKLVIPSRDSKC